jgi:hypothetical protein
VLDLLGWMHVGGGAALEAEAPIALAEGATGEKQPEPF